MILIYLSNLARDCDKNRKRIKGKKEKRLKTSSSMPSMDKREEWARWTQTCKVFENVRNYIIQKPLEQIKTYSDLEQKWLKDFYIFHKIWFLIDLILSLFFTSAFFFSQRVIYKYIKTHAFPYFYFLWLASSSLHYWNLFSAALRGDKIIQH